MRGRSAFAIYGVLSLVLGWLVASVHPDVLAPGPGEVVRYRIDGRAGPIAVGGGAAWVIAPDDGWGVLWRIDENTGAATRLAPTRGSSWPTFGEGYAWAPCAGTTDNPCGGPLVLKLDPRTGEVLDRIPVPGTGRIATGLGAVWAPGDGVSRLDVARGGVRRFGGGRVSWVGATNGSLWVGADTGIRELNPSNGSVVRTFHVPYPCMFSVAANEIWAETCRPATTATGEQAYFLVRIDAVTGEARRVPVATPLGMVEAGGRLWMARYLSFAAPTVALEAFDPRTLGPTGDRITFSLDTGRHPPSTIVGPIPIFLAADGDSIWLSNLGGDEVVRVGIPA